MQGLLVHCLEGKVSPTLLPLSMLHRALLTAMEGHTWLGTDLTPLTSLCVRERPQILRPLFS